MQRRKSIAERVWPAIVTRHNGDGFAVVRRAVANAVDAEEHKQRRAKRKAARTARKAHRR